MLVTQPSRAFLFAIGMGLLGANAAFNWIDARPWNDHPWMGWLLGGMAFLCACYFLSCAVLGWQSPQLPSEDMKSST
jgi:drug/metabolite transporter (DMT)-like permease